jgi:hypothetical protein
MTMVVCSRCSGPSDRRDLLAHLGIKVARRFVGEQDAQVAGDGARDRDPGCCPPELRRKMMEPR